jgi:hypothetical protein
VDSERAGKACGASCSARERSARDGGPVPHARRANARVTKSRGREKISRRTRLSCGQTRRNGRPASRRKAARGSVSPRRTSIVVRDPVHQPPGRAIASGRFSFTASRRRPRPLRAGPRSLLLAVRPFRFNKIRTRAGGGSFHGGSFLCARGLAEAGAPGEPGAPAHSSSTAP